MGREARRDLDKNIVVNIRAPVSRGTRKDLDKNIVVSIRAPVSRVPIQDLDYRKKWITA